MFYLKWKQFDRVFRLFFHKRLWKIYANLNYRQKLYQLSKLTNYTSSSFIKILTTLLFCFFTQNFSPIFKTGVFCSIELSSLHSTLSMSIAESIISFNLNGKWDNEWCTVAHTSPFRTWSPATSSSTTPTAWSISVRFPSRPAPSSLLTLKCTN